MKYESVLMFRVNDKVSKVNQINNQPLKLSISLFEHYTDATFMKVASCFNQSDKSDVNG